MSDRTQSGDMSPTPRPRWERESEDLRTPEPEPRAPERTPRATGPRPPEQMPCATGPYASDPEPEATTEWKIPFEDDEEDAEWPEREPRLAAARESLSGARDSARESLAATRESLSATASRVGRWLHSLDRRPEFHAGRDPVAELTPGPSPHPASDPDADSIPEDCEPEPERGGTDGGGIEIGVRFPTAPLGYSRQAVESHIALLEQEIAELREQAAPPLSIEEEIERLGEQTASILVVAHDKAHETARRAQQQAARAVREAAADAERITTAAERRLRELDEETDAVWRERERLLEDVREVARTLVTLADAASERFPAAPEPMAPEASAAPSH